MGQGRRWLAVLVVWLLAFTAIAAELPNAPLSDRPQPPVDLAELRYLGPPPAFDPGELAAQPVVLCSDVVCVWL